MKLPEALRSFDARLLGTKEGRIALTKHDPLLFAAVYLPHKLYDQAHESIADVSLNDFHLDVVEYAKSWTRPLKDFQHTHKNDCFIAPRMTGKSTWINHILPIWAGAHLHKRYIIAFSDSDTQAQKWLSNFKTEVLTNARLQEDFPEFCVPATQGKGVRAYMDNRNITKRGNGFILQAAGADNNTLGANVDGLRPEVILFDDIEPTESNYSAHEVKKRLNTVLSGHFYLNTFAIKVFIGTTTMPDSIIDQIRKVGDLTRDFGDEAYDLAEPEQRWVLDNSITCHYWPAIVETPDGEASLWPERWSMDDLNKTRHTREFAMNMMNRPISLEGGFWDEQDIAVEDATKYGNTIISIDPAVTTKRTSDFTGIAVISRGADRCLYVRHAEQTRLNSDDLKAHVIELIETYDAKVVYVETNQGGDLWSQVFNGIPAKYRGMRNTEKKELRAAKAHDLYKRGYVKHARHFPALEEQMLAFPRVAHDDLVDAVASGVLYFTKPGRRVSAKELNYLEA